MYTMNCIAQYVISPFHQHIYAIPTSNFFDTFGQTDCNHQRNAQLKAPRHLLLFINQIVNHIDEGQYSTNQLAFFMLH